MSAENSKSPRQPKITPEQDPADAFAQSPIAAGIDPDDVIDPPPKPGKGKSGKRKDPPREPRTEAPDEEPPMDPLDAAAEIIGLTDNLFMAVAAIRQYDQIALPDGRPLLPIVTPDDAKKERLKKALARVMKSAGTKMSPGAGLALAAFTCYGAPVIAMEMARSQIKKAAQ